MKKTLTMLLALIIFCSISAATAAADDTKSKSLENFRLHNSYVTGKFSDINETAWYGIKHQAVIKQAYELSIMNGMGNGTFCPNSNLKISEAIKMAAVIRSIYNGEPVSFTAAGTPWYQGYIHYAVSNDIISADIYKEYNVYATRAQMASIFAKAVPASELQQINTINSISDVSDNSSNSAIYSLYRAGVLTGDSVTRAFRPDHKISRAEAAAIVTRLIMPSARQHFEILTDNADLKSHGPEYAVFQHSGVSLALGYQSENILKNFFNTDPIHTEKYGFTDASNIFINEYQGLGKVKYLMSDYSAGGIYVFGIDITSNDYKMENGIQIGSTPQDLFSVYGHDLLFEGKSIRSEYDTYIYYPGDSSPWSSIRFIIDDGMILRIEFGCSIY